MVVATKSRGRQGRANTDMTTRFWQRRIAAASVVWCVLIFTAYAIGRFADFDIPSPILDISLHTLIGATITLALSLFLRLVTPKKRFAPILVFAVFACNITTTALLILGSGGVEHSPYLIIWALMSGVSLGVGLLGGALVAGVSIAYMMWRAATYAITDIDIIYVSVSTYVPLLIGYILWGKRRASTKPEIDQEERDYHDLASELRQVAGKSEVVINAIDDGVIALDSQGTIELINPAAQRMIGWGKHDALGLNYRSVLKLVDSRNQPITDTTDPIAKTLTTNQALVDETLSLVTSAGKHILLSIVATPVGQLGAGIIVVFRNVTRKKTEEREQTEFISTASHEMRTPVASIEGYLGLALNPATATIDAKAREFLTKAHAASQHLGHLFQDLLDVTKLDDGRLVSNPEVVDLAPLVSEVVDGFAPMAADKNLRLIFTPNSSIHTSTVNPIYYIDVDPNHFREVLANLVENAVKYTYQGEVVIDMTGDDFHVTISVRDTGIGIPKEDQSHLFQKFYRVDSTDTRTIGGTGLGLYLCRKLTESMGGRIWVESEFGKGSTFFLDFPRLPHEEAMRRIDAAAINATVLPETTPAVVQPVTAVVTPPSAAVQPATPTPVQPVATPIAPAAAPPVPLQPTTATPAAAPAATPIVTQPALHTAPAVTPPAPVAPVAPTTIQTQPIATPATPAPVPAPTPAAATVAPTPVAAPIPAPVASTPLQAPAPTVPIAPITKPQPQPIVATPTTMEPILQGQTPQISPNSPLS